MRPLMERHSRAYSDNDSPEGTQAVRPSIPHRGTDITYIELVVCAQLGHRWYISRCPLEAPSGPTY